MRESSRVLQRSWAGLASQGFRPLSAVERAHLSGRIRQLRTRTFGLLGLPVASLALAFVAVRMVPEPVNLLGCFGLGLVAPSALLLAAGDAWKRQSKLTGDLARGEVERFEGRLAVAMEADRALDALLRAQAFGEALDQPHEVD